LQSSRPRTDAVRSKPKRVSARRFTSITPSTVVCRSRFSRTSYVSRTKLPSGSDMRIAPMRIEPAQRRHCNPLSSRVKRSLTGMGMPDPFREALECVNFLDHQ
jgi:hypothetical protein